MIEQLIGGRYQIVTTLGSGGFGQTYLAEDLHQFNLRCVVKKLQPLSLSPETWSLATKLFQREAQTQYRLGHHPQIPELLAYFEEQQEFYLVQEWIEGHNLSEELTSGKQLRESEVIALLQDILEPLAFVHQQQVIHRDLKPSNLIRRHRDHKIVLIDFGAVKELAATKILNPQGETQIITTIGTPGYMPSEQSAGKARLSSDIYAVGIIGIQALTGKRPQELEEEPETAEIIWRHHTPVHSQLTEILAQMVRYDFRQRYRSATEALAGLQQLNSQLDSSPKLVSSSKIAVTQAAAPTAHLVSTTQPKFAWFLGIMSAALLLGWGGWYAERQLTRYRTITTIQESKEKGNYTKCIKLSQAVSKYPALSEQLQSFHQDCQNLQAQSYLAKAQQLAREKKYDQAREEVKRISPVTSSYSQAQALLKQWNPANHEFARDYQSAIDSVAESDYQQALEKLYLAADKAIVAEQSDLLLAEIRKQESGIWQPVAQSTQPWQLLKDSLIKAEPNNYQLTYQRARLRLEGDQNRHHAREFELLFTAARQAIDNQQSEKMLSQLKQDQQDRFKNLARGHSEWINLLKALEQNNKQWLEQ